jgi:hypothetical protein
MRRERTYSAQQPITTSRLKIGQTCPILEGLGSTANFAQNKPGGSIPGHIRIIVRIMCLRCGTHVPSCSKCAPQIGGLYYIHHIMPCSI